MFAQGRRAARHLRDFFANRVLRLQTLRARHLELRASARDSEIRGLRLVREWLSPEQRAQFDARRYFEVTGCHSGKKYRIYYGSQANIVELDQAGRPQLRWCFVPILNLVPGDVMLAQKIALETNERDALAVANKIPGGPPFFQRYV